MNLRILYHTLRLQQRYNRQKETLRFSFQGELFGEKQKIANKKADKNLSYLLFLAMRMTGLEPAPGKPRLEPESKNLYVINHFSTLIKFN